MKLWQKEYTIVKDIETFTVGMDRELDVWLAKYDVQGNIAHATMLESIGLLTAEELVFLKRELLIIYKNIENGHFKIDDGVEDVHSQVEFILTEKLGDIGKKIHSGRSRNDQVLVDLRLYFRTEIQGLTTDVQNLFDRLLLLSEQHKEAFMPGYTHTQIAMMSSFGLWFGAYAESLVDDLMLLQSVYKINNQNPLGSAAGFGNSFPLDRTLTTKLLGFEDLNYNVVHAQLGRGKTEQFMSFAVASIAATLGKLAMDICTFMCQNYGFLTFPDELTTGSSIMPHKKNPDVFELIRAKCNRLQALPSELALMTSNLISGYHRDFQLTKEVLLPAIKDLKSCLTIAEFMLSNIIVKKDILKDDKYAYLYSVEEVNRLVLEGLPFRDAYKKVGMDIENNQFNPSNPESYREQHTHEGSIGNLCTEQIQGKMNRVIEGFNFEEYERVIEALLR